MVESKQKAAQTVQQVQAESVKAIADAQARSKNQRDSIAIEVANSRKKAEEEIARIQVELAKSIAAARFHSRF